MSSFDAVFEDARVVTPSGVIERGWVGVSGGRIAAIEAGDVPDSASAASVHRLDGAWLGPGFIDVHVHGSDGVDVMTTDEEGMRNLARFFARHGVTSFLVGTYTLQRENILATLQLVKKVGRRVEGGANILGVYMEGPFLNPEKKGAHREKLLRAIDREEVTEYLDTGVVSALVVAPELPDADWLIHELVRRGITAVAGHTNATYSQIEHGMKQGVTSITHTFNGMRGIHHREPGAAGAALLLDDLACELIADGMHIAPELFRLFWRMKGADKIALITDANQAGGLPDGDYHSGDRDIVVKDGVGRLPDGTISSSAKTYDYDFALFCKYTGASFDEAWPAASGTPARIAGVYDSKGSIEVGKDADFAVLSDDGAVIGTAVNGEWLPVDGSAS
ncbi:N-acetylglucosamine-6-phosphate deacetylase [Cryobacterium mesophilum]|uniref:N-acetylglucosamine-6-phosphate deacetylase n=1 Tax=Terrimesophilobacter mesophilus TaxID=433647 RepID=A0A4R8VB31_9MICO|nr:N-acetylglucosamine-6-phosphate deacetylase [Terrimesophilobacter mesophilus]MBB5633259.1 N-acetylglucosamine-6-phosphate deacetylase [Terrimesophilobacter mesophilus]TFB80003.1 N-acetylglucosamine-6-phosphate deacetylase [Terrimesophilobacter mesophilus]